MVKLVPCGDSLPQRRDRLRGPHPASSKFLQQADGKAEPESALCAGRLVNTGNYASKSLWELLQD